MKTILTHFIVALIAIFVGSLLSLLGRELYDKNMQFQKLVDKNAPVVNDMEIRGVISKDGKLLIHMFGKKGRDCGAPLSVYGDYGPNHEYRFVEISFLDDKQVDGSFKTPDDNKTDNDSDIIDFGWWSVKPDPTPDPFSLYSIHSCDGELVITLIGRYSPDDYIKEIK